MLKNGETVGGSFAWKICDIGLFRIYPPIDTGESILGWRIRSLHRPEFRLTYEDAYVCDGPSGEVHGLYCCSEEYPGNTHK
jgi:hypothetical protein